VDEPGELVYGVEHLRHVGFGRDIGAKAPAMSGQLAGEGFVHSVLFQQLQHFYAVLVGPAFVVHVVQDPGGGPDFGIAAKTRREMAHYAAHGFCVLDEGFAMGIFGENFH
jgi:hypothetical protein